MKHLFLSCLLVSAMSVNAQSTYYVDQNNGSDENPGTEAAPWSSLNAAKWTDGCTVVLKGEYYMDATESNNVAVNATLKGVDGAVIYGYEPGEPDSSDYATFFTCSNKTFTVQNVDIANYQNSGDINGGIFQCGEEAELILDNVKISNVLIGGTSGRGGAIYTSGKVTATNVTIENCSACKGGAVFVAGNNPVKFTSSTFLNNNNTIGKTCEARGGAFYILSNDEGSNVSVDKCYFEGNTADSSADSYRGYAVGGCFELSGVAPTLSVTNSTFYKNVAGFAGSILCYEKNEEVQNSIDIRFANNAFLENTVLTSQGTNHGVLIYFNGGSSDKINGLFSYINNSSVNNNTERNQSVVFINSLPIDIIIANNLSLDQKTVSINGANTYLGYGFVLEETYPDLFNSYQIYTNIIEGGFGGTRMAITSDYLNNSNIGINPEYRAYTGIAEELTMQDGIGYLAIASYGYGVNLGMSSITYNGVEMVPSTDILGHRANGNRDLGSWEYDGIEDTETGIGAISADNVKVAYNSGSNTISVSKTAHFINVYNTNGALVAHASNTDNLSVANLNSGIYVVVAVVDNAPVTAKIIR